MKSLSSLETNLTGMQIWRGKGCLLVDVIVIGCMCVWDRNGQRWMDRLVSLK